MMTSSGLRSRRTHRAVALVSAVAVACVALAAVGSTHALTAAAATPPAQDWPTFLHDPARSSSSGETILNTANVPTLKKAWSFATGGSIAASAAIVGGVAYVGSWDGNEYALNATTGAQIWKTNLGTTTDPNCTFPVTAGITSAAAVVGGLVYVGGGNGFWYALNAADGSIAWSVPTGDNSPAGGHYNWSSPLIYNGFAYIGISSNCDNPLVQGQLLKVDLNDPAHPMSRVSFVPDTQVGGGVWTSPTVDAATNTIFVSTGTINQYTQTLSQAIVSLDASTLAVKGSWQLPFEAATFDSDWGTTPTLTSDSAGNQLLSVANKNGILYTFNRNNISAGPVWQTRIALGGDCPTCGDGAISSGAFVSSVTVNVSGGGTYSGPVLFYANGNAILNGNGVQGAVRAINPGNGAVLWTHPTNGPLIASIAYDNGFIAEAQGTTVEALNATTGQSLFDYTLNQPFYSAPAISMGKILIGGADGNEYAFGLPSTTPTIPADANCPASFICQDVNSATPGSERVNPDGSWTVTASGSQIHGTSDQFRFISQNLSGDGQVVAQVTQQSTQNALPQAGIMMRESNNWGSPFYAVLAYPNDNIENLPQPKVIVWYRSQWGQTSVELTMLYPAPLPRYLMIQRTGDSFTASYSTDGTHYTVLPGTTHTVVMPTTLMSGVAVDSGKNGTFGTATFNHVSLGPTTITPRLAATTHPCPAGWTCSGVNNPSPGGDQTLVNGVWTIAGAGNNITSGNHATYGHEDTFHFVYQPQTGDQTMTARFTGFTGTKQGALAESGLMMRASTDPHAPYYGVFMNPTKGGLVEWRVNPNIVARAAFLPQASWTAPIWLRIIRYTDTRFTPAPVYYSAAYSTDGTSWSPVLGSTAAIDMGGGSGGPTLMGLAGSAGGVNLTTSATFDNLGFAPTGGSPPGICPAGWSCDEVGTSHVTGNQTFLNQAFTVQAAGDLWDVYDQFRYVYRPFSGDGTVSARVVSMQNGGEWQKAGVAIRSSAVSPTDPQAPYYGVFLTPQHGIVVQWRSAEKATTNQAQIGTPTSFTTPIYLMVARYTDSAHGGAVYYTGYYSTDNVNFTQIPGSTVPLNLEAGGAGLTAGLVSDSYSSGLATTTFDSWVVLGSAPPPAGICPSAWMCNDVGGALPAGSQTNSGGSWSFSVGGSDIWTTADQFHLMWQSLPADGTVTAHVTGATGNAGPWAKGGVMLRQAPPPGSDATSDAGAPYYGLFVTPGNGTVVQWRPSPGAVTNQIQVPGSMPAYLQVIRWTSAAGTTWFEALTSPDGNTWTAVPGSLMTQPGMSGALLSGIATDSYNQGSAATWAVDHVAVTSVEVLPQGVCPDTWTCQDIGSPTPPGAQNDSNGSWTVQGGGSDIWDTTDHFRYVAQTVTNNGTVSAHITSQSSSNPWAKAGVMLRLTNDPQAPYYGAFVTPGNGIVLQWRAAQAATTSSLQVNGGVPAYLRVSRWTDTTGATPATYFTAYTSSDGTTWTAIPGSTMLLNSISGTLYAGLAVTSHDTSNLSTVAADGLTITQSAAQPAGICPGAYACTDIGGATPQGAQNNSGSSWTVQGGGTDIWTSADQFRYISSTIHGDGSISAAVSSQSNTSPWAKAGLMLRATTDPGSPYYGVLLTPGNGLLVQYRDAQGNTSVQLAGTTGTVPTYLQITRSGTTFSAATSPDGSTWTAVPGSTITLANLSGALLQGLAVCSHDPSNLSIVTFDAVALAP